MDIWNWVLEPYEKFGPISLVDMTRKKLEVLLGPPTKDLTIKNGQGYITYETAEYQLFAWVGADEGKIDNFLIPRYPISVRCHTQKKQSSVPKDKEQISVWMQAEDPLARYEKMGEKEVLLAPTLGLVWDDKSNCFAIYNQQRRIHTLLKENYFTASVEFLLDPEFEKELAELRLQHPQLFKSSWSPILVSGSDEARGLPRCHYGGLPLLTEGTAHPTCKVCEKPLYLLVQMDLAYLPEFLQETFGHEGLFQLFYCSTEECLTEHSDPYAPPNLIYLCRVLKDTNLKLGEDKNVRVLPQQQIVDWFKEPDGPDDETLEAALGKPLEEIFSDDLGEECYRFHFPYTTDKWGGLPSWVQENDLEDHLNECPKCKERCQVNFVTQYNSNPEFECGDGRIFVYQCTKHKDQFMVILDL
jgi:hypothetical protein